ncbi:MAG: hypothetical protein ACOH2N_19880 [Devosia sp.]
MVATLVAIAIFGLLSLPGWILAMHRPHPIWVHIAAGFCSQLAIILAAALLAIALPSQLDIRAVVPLAMIVSLGTWFVVRGRRWHPPIPPARWTFLVPILATLTAALITWSAISLGEDGLSVRAWFNADGFKHLGHVHALSLYGLPARDIFGGGVPLAYYWLFYVIPGLGAALHGDAVMALIASGLVQTFAFWIVLHGLLRSAGANERWASILALVAWLSPTLDGLLSLTQFKWNLMASATSVNVEGVGSTLMNAFTLFRVSLYIPQHQLTLAGLLSWATLAALPRKTSDRPLHWLSVAPLACAGAVSTLLGVSCLAVFALSRLLDARITLLRRIAGIAGVGLAALAVPLVLGILAGGSGLDSPIFASAPADSAPLERLLLVLPGMIPAFGVSLVGLFGLRAGLARPDLSIQSHSVLIFAFALTLVGAVVLLAAALLDAPRMVLEIQLRTSLLLYLGLTLGCVWLLRISPAGHQSLPGGALAVALPLLVMGLITPLHDTIWHARSTANWIVQVPPDDLAVLERIKAEVPPESQVVQYPELPFVSHGRDVWTSIIAGRMVYASDRSTQWTAQAGRLQQVVSFFAGQGPLPDGNFGYLYLSRTLHPKTYDQLMVRMGAEPGWTQSLCLPDACLWRRN